MSLRRLKVQMKKVELNWHQRQTVLQVVSSLKPRVKWKALLRLDKATFIQDIIFPYNLLRLDATIKQQIANDKFSVMQVAGEGGYAYSVGLWIVNKHDHELVVNVSGDVSGQVINEVADRWSDGKYPTEPFESRTLVLVADETIKSRLRIIKAPDPEKVIAERFANIRRWTGESPKNIYWIEMAGPDNKFPDEAIVN